MKKLIFYGLTLLIIVCSAVSNAQENDVSTILVEDTALFADDSPLKVDLTFSLKELRKNTNDSTYFKLPLKYSTLEDEWFEIPSKLRVRGNYRLDNCYFAPLKLKIKKKHAKGTLFEDNRTLKIVVPCLNEKDNNDNVVKEYLAYKIYEILSPYHFNTRLLDISFKEVRRKKVKPHQLKGFLIEDDKDVAKRSNGKVYKNINHPLNYDAVSSVRNAMFQCMIGNTDFSSAYQHNCKAIYVDTKIIPIPYDFDMSGFVDASYAVVSQIQEESLNLSSVSERLYRGFVREKAVFEQVRQEFLDHQPAIIALLDAHAVYFENTREFTSAKEFILSFFSMLQNEDEFKTMIIEKARKG